MRTTAKNRGIFFMVMVLFISLFTACTSKGDTADPKPAAEEKQENVTAPAEPSPEKAKPALTEPVEISFLNTWDDARFEKMFGEKLRKKFPHVTWKLIPKLEPEMIATGNVPDLITLPNWEHVNGRVKEGVLMDLTPLIDGSDIGVDRLEQSNITSLKLVGNGSLYALPWNRAVEKLYINKEVFDKFNVPYPDPNVPMTWEETVELAKKLTGTVDGVHYRGIDLQNPIYILDSNRPADLNENNEPLYQKEPAFRKYFEILQGFWSIPGIFPEGVDPSTIVHYKGVEDFATQKNVAMLVFWTSDWELKEAELEHGLQWDYRPMPVWPDTKDQGPISYSNVIGIGATTKHKEQAYEILSYIESDEFQMANAKTGMFPISTTPEVEQAYLDYLKTEFGDKSFESIFALKPSSPHYTSPLPKYFGAKADHWGRAETFAKLDKDINTVLREMDEEAIKAVETLKAQGK